MSLGRLIKRNVLNQEVPKKTKKDIVAKDSSAEGLKKALDRYLKDTSSKERFRKISGFHPSYNKNCARWWYLLFEGAPSTSTIPARTQRIFDNGHAVHARIYSYFEAMKILVDTEIPLKLSKPIPITGTADGIIDWNGQKLIEVKSIGTEGFQFRKYYNKPKDDHYKQAQLYMYILKMEEGYVIYEDKNTQEVLIFHITRDDEVVEKYFRSKGRVWKKIQAGELPARPYKRDSKHCTECDLVKYCWDVLND